MKQVTFDIDNDKNLIVQFPVFIQPYAQQPLILYQIETVPVPTIDKNTQVQSYTSSGRQTLHCTKLRNIHYNQTAGIKNM